MCGEKRVWFWLERDGHGTVHPWERWPDSEANPFGKVEVSSNERRKRPMKVCQASPCQALLNQQRCAIYTSSPKGFSGRRRKAFSSIPSPVLQSTCPVALPAQSEKQAHLAVHPGGDGEKSRLLRRPDMRQQAVGNIDPQPAEDSTGVTSPPATNADETRNTTSASRSATFADTINLWYVHLPSTRSSFLSARSSAYAWSDHAVYCVSYGGDAQDISVQPQHRFVHARTVGARSV